jgi:hypothetical protein
MTLNVALDVSFDKIKTERYTQEKAWEVNSVVVQLRRCSAHVLTSL